MAELSDEHKAALLALYHVNCPTCTGHGEKREVFFEDEHTIMRLDTDCPTCNGTGYHLSGATRETWPFWNCMKHFANPMGEWCCEHAWPVFPRPDDDAAAVKVAGKMRAWIRLSEGYAEVSSYGGRWWDPAICESTLLLALCVALVEAQP